MAAMAADDRHDESAPTLTAFPCPPRTPAEIHKAVVSRFSIAYPDYMRQVPMFFPRWTAIKALQQANQPPA